MTNKNSKNYLFENTKISSKRFNYSERELIENFSDRNSCNFALISNTEFQIIRYSIEDRDGDEDDLIVNRIVSKIILN